MPKWYGYFNFEKDVTRKGFIYSAFNETGATQTMKTRWRFKPILSASLRFHSHLSGGLRLRSYRAVAGNHKFSSRFSVFACFCGGYSNRVKRLRRLSSNFILPKASLFNKGLSFRARPSQSGLPSVSPVMWGGVGR